ncbi:MAG: DNA topoisomerase IV subunit A [Solobacterium sp.]|jgi:topoisomerase-4 subunit A|nr:DNA topoisomerase IV subunit A [Solobacterium sp.]MCH4047933.1 DNA topoisomerase IV subunit A [Solobacterium sp.]MCH4075481.1 DNA topoisomerase IV subunit A [Solobacterium sp.]MCI1313648.1 DNA topoisomerase IV subunit A [Solobacterium sp.]MCI1346217.1 DNA topoisomerase IV subunit A [Solobacterium sp.]
MAKKKQIEDNTKYIPERLEDIMSSGFGRYAKAIIQERALPDARDGLKPVQRRILYAMYHDGNTWDHAYRKSAKTVGLVIGNYHPHGDSSVYDAMVRMSQDWKVRLPLIDMHGNNGSIDDDPAAAMRYTEVRLAKVTQIMEDDLDKNTVEMAPNFDDTENEPTVLPVPFPVMLVNGATGIAAGYATNMPPHNLREVVNAAVYRLQNPDCSLDDLMEIIPGPDFPTGGIVQGRKGIHDAFATGRGRIVVRAKAEIQDTRTCQQIIVTEIPYEVIKSQLVHQMDEIRFDKKIDGILDVRDESDRNGLRIVVDVRKDADASMILNYFYKNTDLQIYYSYNNVAIIDKTPVQVGLIGLLDAFIDFRKEVVLRRSKYMLDKMEARCHVIEGLMKAVSILDEVIRIIRASKDKADAKVNLEKAFGFDEPQAEAIVSLRLYRLSNTDIVQLKQEFAELANQIEDMKAIIENENVLKSVITKELKSVGEEYGDERRTVIEDKVSEIVIDKASMIPNEHVVVTVSRDSYLKRVSMRSYNATNDAPTGLKAGDILIGSIECDTVDTLLLFTSKGNYAYLPVWQIEEGKWKDIGMHMNKVIRIDGDDKIINCILVKDFHTYASIVTVSDGGYIKRTPVDTWKVERNSKVMPAMKMGPHDHMVHAFCVYEGQEIAIVSKNGMSYRFSVDQIPTTGVKSKGVKAINLAAGDHLASGCVLNPETSSLLYLNENGGMKRVKLDEVPVLNRPSKGVLICKKVKSNPAVLYDVMAVDAARHVTLADSQVQTIRMNDVPLKAREAGFALPLTLEPGYITVSGIEECRVIDFPEGVTEEVHDDIEKISLFEDE